MNRWANLKKYTLEVSKSLKSAIIQVAVGTLLFIIGMYILRILGIFPVIINIVDKILNK